MPARAPAHVYVYYRVAADTAAARAAVAALLAAVVSATGVAGRLLARCDDASTWMEIYEPVDDPTAFMRRLAGLAQTHRVAAFAAGGERHTECFAALAATKSGSSRRGVAAGAR
jgi:hypothetical protein